MSSFHKRIAKDHIFRSKLFLFTCVLLLICLSHSKPAIAQYQNYSKITLKNGTKIKGYVIDSFKTKFIKIRIDTNQPLHIYYSNIHKITFKDEKGRHTLIENNIKLAAENISLHDHSFYHEFRGGILLGEDNASITLHNINGFQFNRFLAPGLGVGFDSYENFRTVPVYAHIKGYIFDRKVSPFYFTDVGYGFAWYKNADNILYKVTDVHGGYYWQVGLGYRISFYNWAMLVTLGYKNQQSGLKYAYSNYQPWMDAASDSNVEVSEKRTLRRVSFSVGFLF